MAAVGLAMAVARDEEEGARCRVRVAGALV